MKLDKAMKRDRKISKRKYGMRRDGDSVFLIQKEQEKRAAIVRKNRKELDDNSA